jgi:hypothetical protein
VAGIRDPAYASLQDLKGWVEIQADDGTWRAANVWDSIGAGQRVRTGALSSAGLAFFDGSQARLGPNTDVAVEELDARTSDGPRIVVLYQWSGETDHEVAPAPSTDSRYKVRTPSAVGTAKGTAFHTHVAPGELSRFSVDQGVVAVTGNNVTVNVAAGQSTTVDVDQSPAKPAFRITGEGEVSQTGTTWIIAGQPFETHKRTIIVGNPQVGDWVYVEGRLLIDGTRVADWIGLLRRSPANRFTITGRVDAKGRTKWTIAGQAIGVDEGTEIDEAIRIGNLVRAEGVILEDGALLAERIRLVDEMPGLPFYFTGVIQVIGRGTWTISGATITIDDETAIDEELEVGKVVEVRGWILDSGIWLARSIHRAEDVEPTFEITGKVTNIDPWVVAGIPFETRAWTEIEPDIDVGDLVKVKGRILQDGTWVAYEIERLDDDSTVLRIVFVGEVESIDPWVVSGIPLEVNGETLIDGDIEVGDLVKVTVSILTDGTWLATEIELLEDDGGQGCVYITAVVVGVRPGWIDVPNWSPIELDGVIVEGKIQVGSVILMQVCVDDDGNIEIVRITVIYQPEPAITPTPPPPPPPDEGGKVTICHKPNGKNPHTITISRSALPAHQAHGDTIGPCK